MRFSQKRLSSESAALAVATLLPLLLPILCSAEQLTPAEALDRYLAKAGGTPPASSDSVFTVQIDASIPALHKQGSMTGLKLVSYRGRSSIAVFDSPATNSSRPRSSPASCPTTLIRQYGLPTSPFHAGTIGSPTTRYRITTGLPRTCFS